MNYIPQIAEMLGVEIGEQFKLLVDGKESDECFFLSGNGYIYYKSEENQQAEDWLFDILTGKVEVIKNAWKPQVGDDYYAWDVGIDDSVCWAWNSNAHDLQYWKIGNYFKTKEEAEIKGRKIMEQIIKEYENA